MTKLLVLVALAAFLAVAATPETPDIIIDNVVWYDANGGSYPFVSGNIGPGQAGDWMDGDAVCNTNYPFPPPQFFRIVSGGLQIDNTVFACGTVAYYIVGGQYSDRQDGNYDHLSFYGWAMYPNQPNRPPNTPNIQSWGAACSQDGTDKYGNPNGLWGEMYIKQYTPGTCWAP